MFGTVAPSLPLIHKPRVVEVVSLLNLTIELQVNTKPNKESNLDQLFKFLYSDSNGCCTSDDGYSPTGSKILIN